MSDYPDPDRDRANSHDGSDVTRSEVSKLFIMELIGSTAVVGAVK